MPTTRAARAAAARAARCLTEVLPADVLGLVLYQLTLAHDIAAAAPTCRLLCDAAKLALKLRPFSGEVVTLSAQETVRCVAAAPDGRVITGSDDNDHTGPEDNEIKVWRGGACERTVSAHDDMIYGVSVLPGGERFVSASCDRTAKLWTLEGALERTFEMGAYVYAVAALPDGMHFVVGTGWFDETGLSDVRLYHVDGTLVHTFEGHVGEVLAVAVTRDGQHIISGSSDELFKVWSVATKSLVSTCRGHGGVVRVLAAMPDGQRILSGAEDPNVRVWLLDGTLKNTFKLHNHHVLAIVALPDNQHALSGGYDNNIKLFNVNDGTVLRTFRHHLGWREVNCLALLPDGLRFVSGSADHTARIVYHGLAPQ